jgi:PAS domain S-box-containing protein
LRPRAGSLDMEPTGSLTWNDLSEVWQSVFDSSHNGIVVIDKTGTIVLYNLAARRIFGDTEAVIVGRHFSDVRRETWPDLKEVLESGQPQVGKKLVLPEATIIANRTPVIADGELVGAVSVFQDISEYEALISELHGYKKLHRELEAIIESSDDGLYITDGKANTLRVNSAYETITGLSRHDLVGRNMVDLVRERVFDHSVTLEVLKKRQQVTFAQNIKGDKTVMVTGTPICDDEDRIVLVVTNVRDMTLLNRVRTELEASRRLSSYYERSLLEHEKYEHALQNMVVKSTAMRQVLQKAVKVAAVDTSVLVSGESGVGKSMLARLIHLMSPRKDGPFLKINCSTVPQSLMESELFGYEKGAFTGADPQGKTGLMEMAQGGTLFLDEIGDLSLAMQVKLLQVIEEKTFTRVGATKHRTVDARIVAATNRDLKAMMKQGDFREDLYYRLHVVPIVIPPLRRRREDIPSIALRTLEKFNETMGLSKRLEPDVIDDLLKYDYPGNVRELINILERMVIMSEGDTISVYDVPSELSESRRNSHYVVDEGMTLKAALRNYEAKVIATALARHETLSGAAKSLGLHPTTLWRKMRALEIARPSAGVQ